MAIGGATSTASFSSPGSRTLFSAGGPATLQFGGQSPAVDASMRSLFSRNSNNGSASPQHRAAIAGAVDSSDQTQDVEGMPSALLDLSKCGPNTTQQLQQQPNQNPAELKHALKKLSKLNWRITTNQAEITPQVLAGHQLLIVPAPKSKFNANEFDAIRSFVTEHGHAVLYLGAEAKDSGPFGTNFNFLLEEFGISVSADTVVRTAYTKYFHPKEALVTNGVLNREILRAAGKEADSAGVGVARTGVGHAKGKVPSNALHFVYPFGATLLCEKPAIPILSTGSVSFPLNRPVAAVYEHGTSQGKIAAVGSCAMFSDAYIDKEENAKVWDVLVRWLGQNAHSASASEPGHAQEDRITWHAHDAEDPEIADYHYIPDTTVSAGLLRSCLQETEDVPNDFTTLFDSKMFSFDPRRVPEVHRLYEELHVPLQALTLIPPKFEVPLPRLRPAVFPPALRDLPPPPLELWDLDGEWANVGGRLAELTNKCTDDDLEYYVRQAGEIAGVCDMLDRQHGEGADVAAFAGANARQQASTGKWTGKQIMTAMFRQLVAFKKLNQEGSLQGV